VITKTKLDLIFEAKLVVTNGLKKTNANGIATIPLVKIKKAVINPTK
jgi:hypothetical protein